MDIQQITNAQASATGLEGSTVQFLTFTIDQEEYGVDIMTVREVKGWTETTRLPNRPDYIRGVLNLRGVILPIFDLRARFGSGITNASEKHVIVILAVGERIAGVLVDAVSDILTVRKDEVKPPPQDNANGQNQFVDGLIPVEARMVVLLDIKKLLNSDIEALSDSQTSH